MIYLLALVALLAFAAGFLAGCEYHWRFARRMPEWSSREYGGERTKREWNTAYDEAMQSRDWQTCDQLMVESPYPEHHQSPAIHGGWT